MKKKKAKTARAGGRARKRSGTPSSTAQTDATASGADAMAHTGMAAQLLSAQRKLWQAGVDVISRGGKVGASTTSIAESLQGGLKKLEDVFDQRVLSSLSHAGMPSPTEIRELMQRVELLSAQVERLSRGRSKG
jgi:hypothetical protein